MFFIKSTSLLEFHFTFSYLLLMKIRKLLVTFISTWIYWKSSFPSEVKMTSHLMSFPIIFYEIWEKNSITLSRGFLPLSRHIRSTATAVIECQRVLWQSICKGVIKLFLYDSLSIVLERIAHEDNMFFYFYTFTFKPK